MAAVSAAFAVAKKKRDERRDEQLRKYVQENLQVQIQEMMANDKDGDGKLDSRELQQWLEDEARKGTLSRRPQRKSSTGEEDGGGACSCAGEPWNLPHREELKEIYENKFLQGFIAVVIVVNFLAIVVEKEIDPYEPEFQSHYGTWSAIDTTCSIIFILELALNLYANFWRPFVRNPWNYLDTVVVLVSLITLCNIELPEPASRIKVLRAFRVLRIFKRIKSLNQILTALLKAIPGVINAFVVMLIFMTIYAILAVDLFRSFGMSGDFETTQTYGEADGQYGENCGVDALECIDGTKLDGRFENNTVITSITPRGFYHGQEYYGTFSRALYTLFQVLTGESWSEAVVRPLVFGYEPTNAIGVGIFFISYILLTQVVLQNVVVAVLLDKFVQDDDKEEDKAGESNNAEVDVRPNTPEKKEPRPSSSGNDASASADAAKLDQLLAEQEMMKKQLQQILDRLNKPIELTA